MSKDHSFDIVSKINLQEVRNAVQMAQKEIVTRFDFKGSQAGVTFKEAELTLHLTADHEAQLQGVLDLVEGKLAKRGVALKAFVWQPAERLPSGGAKRYAKLQQGLSMEQAKAVTKTIKELGLKVQSRIDGDAVRVSGRQIDDLQTTIQTIKTKEFGLPIQVENYR